MDKQVLLMYGGMFEVCFFDIVFSRIFQYHIHNSLLQCTFSGVLVLIQYHVCSTSTYVICTTAEREYYFMIGSCLHFSINRILTKYYKICRRKHHMHRMAAYFTWSQVWACICVTGIAGKHKCYQKRAAVSLPLSMPRSLPANWFELDFK